MRSAGVSEEKALAQLEIFRRGQVYTRLDRACTLNDGILRFSAAELESLAEAYAVAAARGRMMQFIPASGAATRMFKGLLAVLGRADAAFAQLAKEAGQGQPDAGEFLEWFQGLPGFAFAPDLRKALERDGLDMDALMAARQFRPLLEYLLLPKGLGLAERPKALIPFHRAAGGADALTALEEHLAEAVALVRDGNGVCRLHFTVSPQHEAQVLALLESVRGKYERDGTRLLIGLSAQKPSTDTLAADHENRPFRNPDHTLVFRPGGHGALLENLHHTGGDIVFLRNIDNILPARLREGALDCRRTLGGYLVRLQERVFGYLRRLREAPDADAAEEAAHFAEQRLGVRLPDALRGRALDPGALEKKRDFLVRILDRPMRVCAMVKNQGEPGGGPFWVKHKDGSLRLQIVEAAQMETGSSAQRKIAASATHFNPVDMVCGLRNDRGELFKLQDFVDPETSFITSKSKDGKALKALELPGLWNGSMADWSTVFVETPLETFNPVKTVNDLLRPGHQV